MSEFIFLGTKFSVGEERGLHLLNWKYLKVIRGRTWPQYLKCVYPKRTIVLSVTNRKSPLPHEPMGSIYSKGGRVSIVEQPREALLMECHHQTIFKYMGFNYNWWSGLSFLSWLEHRNVHSLLLTRIIFLENFLSRVCYSFEGYIFDIRKKIPFYSLGQILNFFFPTCGWNVIEKEKKMLMHSQEVGLDEICRHPKLLQILVHFWLLKKMI